MIPGTQTLAERPQSAEASSHLPDATELADEAFLLPTTPLQKRLWQAARTRQKSSAFNGAFRVEITGPLQTDTLAEVIAQLGRRHEILTATCAEIDGELHLLVRPDACLELAITDLRSRELAAAEAVAEERCSIIAKTPFDLETGPLAAFELIQIAPDRALLTLTFHQMIIDGWSVSLLLDEIPKLYEAILSGSGAEVPLPALQFGDYAAWLAEAAQTPAVQSRVAEGARRLVSYTRLDVPPDVATAGDAEASAILARTLDPDLVARIQTYCASEGATMFSISLAACFAVLASVTGRSDVSLGSPLGGRGRPELEGIIGPLVTYAILTATAASDTSLGALERQCRDAALDAVAAQDIPLEQVLDRLRADGVNVPEPAYSVAFVSQRGFAGTSAVTHSFAGCRMRTLPSVTQGSLHDLFFFLVERETGWRLAVDYATAKFSDALANDLLDAFVEVIAGLTADPERRLADLDTPALQRLRSRCQNRDVVAKVAPNAPSAEPVAERVDDDSDVLVPASFTQERFHLLAQAAPDNPGFNMPACLRIRGRLSHGLLTRALSALVERQEILRTRFVEHDGVLHQAIASTVEVPLPLCDLSGTAIADRESVARTEIRTDALTPFDLAQTPLLLARLLRFSDDDHVLILVVHHIISDGQSMGLLQQELWALYDTFAKGAAPALPPLPIQYADFAASQRDWLGSDAARAQLDYWKRSLASPLPVADFPLDRPPTFGTPAGNAIEVQNLAPELVAALGSHAASNGTTLFVVTGAAFSALVARYCDQTDILFGCPIANRTADTALVMGPFAGPLAIRVSLDGDPTLGEVVTRVSDSSLDAMANAAVPFEAILELCDARSVEGRSPLFQFYFLYQRAFLQPLSITGLEITPLSTVSVGTPYEVQLALIERQNGVSLQLEYNPTLLDRETVRSVIAYYIGVLEALAAGGANRLSTLPPPPIRATAHRLGQAPSEHRRQPFTAPRTDLEQTLAGIWADLLKREPIGIHDDFFALGGQSILAARLVVEVKRATGAVISVSTVAFARTVAELASLIESGDESRHAPRLVPMRRTGGRTPLFLVHCGGGHVLRYEDLLATLPEDQPVYGLAAPPLTGTEPDLSVESLARLYVAEVRKAQPHGPYQIGGYSFGGLVAYEMARQLSEAGESVPLVAIFDTLNRAAFQNTSLATRAQFQAAYVADRLDRYRRKLASGDFSGFASSAAWAVTRRLRSVRSRATRAAPAVSRSPSPEVVPDTLALFDALSDRYIPGPFNGEVLLFHAEARGAEYRDTPMLGWDTVAAKVAVAFIPGDHMSFIKAPNVKFVADRLRAYQSRSTPEAPAAARA